MASRDRGSDGPRPPGLDPHRHAGDATSGGDDALATDRGVSSPAPPGDAGPRTPPSSPDRRPVAESRRPEDPPIRDPGRYAQTDHFHERVLQTGRYVTVEAVSEAIRRGQLRWNTTDGWRFALVEEGVRVVVVVGDTETASPVVVTAWTELADAETARASERWSDADVETIALRAALSEAPDEHVPERIRPRAVPHPFEMAGHLIASDAGTAHVECVECGGQFRSKGDLERGHCR